MGNLAPLKNLKQLGLFNNELIDPEHISATCAALPKLKELNVDNNPGTRNLTLHYELILRLPKLKILNEEAVKELDRDIAVRFFEDEGLPLPQPDAQKPKMPAAGWAESAEQTAED